MRLHLTQDKIPSLSDLQGPAWSAHLTLIPRICLSLTPSLFPSQPASLLTLQAPSRLRAFALAVRYAWAALPVDTPTSFLSSNHCSHGSFSVRPPPVFYLKLQTTRTPHVPNSPSCALTFFLEGALHWVLVEARGVLVPQPGTEPVSAALEGGFSTLDHQGSLPAPL